MSQYPASPRPAIILIGDPIGFSLQPRLMGALLARLRIGCAYKTLRVPPAALQRWLTTARDTLIGFNVDLPHKTALVPFMDQLSQDAALFRAVNTVLVRDGALWGYNTEGEGFLRMLKYNGITVPERRFTILGAGAAARAIALKLASSGASVTVCCRQREQGILLLERAEAAGTSASIQITGFTASQLNAAFADSDLLLNATPMGMKGVPASWLDEHTLDALPQNAIVCDLVYTPEETVLMKDASRRGMSVFNGLGMLVHQGMLSVELLTDTTIDPDEHMPVLLRMLMR